MRFSISPGIRSLPVFPAESEAQILRKYNLQRLIKMGSNENCYGSSPLAVQAAQKALSKFHQYPEVYSSPLRIKLSEVLNVDPSQIVVGNGSTELVQMIAKTFLQPQEQCITGLETFPIYHRAAIAANAICTTVPLRDHHYDLQGLLGAIGPDTRVIFIANPNNPTGTMLRYDDLVHFLEQVPPNILVVIDEAYREYAAPQTDILGSIVRHQNLIVLRTFSKVYGLAGLRVGYAVCSSEVASYLNPLPYGVNLIAQQAAMAALDDQAHVRECSKKNFEERERMQKEFSARGYPFVPSQSNFILMKVQDPATFCERLLQKGILVAPVPHFHVPDGVRITLGTAEENAALLAAL